MSEAEFEGELQRLVGNQCIGLGVVPGYDIAMVFFTGDITMYIKVESGRLEIEVDAPRLQ